MNNYIWLLLLFFACNVFPANDTVGNDVDIQEQKVFSFDGKNNRIANGAIMTEGFSLEDVLTTVSFDSFFSVTGSISLNQGMIFLTKDLKLGNISKLVSSGTFEGQNHAIHFPCRKKFTLESPACLRTWTEIDQVDVGDDVFSVDWSYDGNWLAVGRDNNSGAELYIYSFNGLAISQTFTWQLGGDVNSVRWHPNELFLAVGQNNGGGEDLRVFKINADDTTIQETEAVELGVNVEAVAWHPKGTYLAMGRNGGANEIRTFNFDASDGSLSNQINFNFAPNQVVQRNALSWDPTGSYFVAGLSDNGTQPTVVVFFFDGVTITETQGIFVPGAGDAESVDWSPCGTFIAAGFDAGTERLRVYEFISSLGTFQELVQARVAENTDDVQGLHWSHDGNCLAFARDANTGTEVRTYFFDKNTKTLTLIDEEDRGTGGGNDVNAIRWSPDGRFFATGDDANDVRVYAVDGDGTYRFYDTNLCFNSDVCVATNLEFKGDSIINARGNIFDIINSSTLYINSGSRVCMRNAHIRSMGDYNGKIVLRDNTSQLRLSNVTVELVYDVTTTIGNIYIDGPGTWYVKDFDWVFSQVATLSVDGVTLWKDSVGIALASTGTINVGPNNEFFDSLNRGTIKCMPSVTDLVTTLTVEQGDPVIDIPHPNQDTILSAPVENDFLFGPIQSKTMTDNMYLAPNRRLRVSLDSLLSGSAHYLHFSASDEPLLLLEPGVTLSLKNIVLKNFSPNHVRYGDASSRLLFGPGVVIELGGNEILHATVAGVSDTSITWTFQTDSTKSGALIRGFGHCLSIPADIPVGIMIDSFATLTVHHTRVRGLGGQQIDSGTFGTKPYNIRALHPSSRLVIKESELALDGNYSFSQGVLDIIGDTWVTGSFAFAYQSPQISYVRSGARFMLDHRTTFSYDAAPGLVVGEDTKRKWRLEDRSAVMQLCGATLHATHTGLLLDSGTLRIKEDCMFVNEAINSSEESVFVIDETNSSRLCLDVGASAELKLDGLFSTR